MDICLAAKRWGEYSPLLIVLVYSTQKTENIFPSKKVLEIKLLKRNCVTLAAQKWVVLANHFDQRTRKVLFTYIRDSKIIHTAPSLPPSFEDALLSLSLLDSIIFFIFFSLEFFNWDISLQHCLLIVHVLQKRLVGTNDFKTSALEYDFEPDLRNNYYYV